MTDWFSTVAEIVHTTPEQQAATDRLLALLAAEPRTIRWVVECDNSIGDVDDWEHKEPCGFAGETDLAIWDDTREAIFKCPRCGGEGSVRYDSVPESSGQAHEATGERHHDCPVYACNICGDRAVDSAPHSDYGQLVVPEPPDIQTGNDQ